MTCARPRREQVTGAIAAGCDMLLFFNDPDEDYGYMMDGYKNGIITEERLSDALHRILGLKAKLGLHTASFVGKERLADVGCEAHRALALKAADEAVTLVKDTQGLLPVNPSQKKRAKVYFVESAPMRITEGTDPAKNIVVEELERVGFEVTLHENFYDMESKHSAPENKFKIRKSGSAEDFTSRYDIVFMFVHMNGYAQENNVRVKWSAGHSNEIPWFIHEVPSVCVSLNYTNHLIDLPMFKTFVNAYSPTRLYIRAAIEKIVGKSEFKGNVDELVWCGRWDTRL